jgi:RHS repeat-associated protein
MHYTSQQYFYHPDHLGSSSFISDASGEACQFLAYLPFGEQWVDQRNSGTYDTPYKFSGKELDTETGYSYFGARYYDSGLSVWLSVDPLADAFNSITPYNYCFDNPVNYFDAHGLAADPIKGFERRRDRYKQSGTERNARRLTRFINRNHVELGMSEASYSRENNVVTWNEAGCYDGEVNIMAGRVFGGGQGEGVYRSGWFAMVIESVINVIGYSFNWYYESLGLGSLDEGSSTAEKMAEVASTQAIFIYIGGIKLNRKEFHRNNKAEILRTVGATKYEPVVGSTPNINVAKGKIVLEGRGPYKGKTYQTDLDPTDYLNP